MADPDYLLGEIRRAIHRYADATRGTATEANAATDVVYTFRKLDDWLSDGGNRPSAWGPQPPSSSVSGRSQRRRGFLPPTAHDLRYYGNADKSITAVCIPCGTPERPWTSLIAPGHETSAFLRLEAEHQGLSLSEWHSPVPADSTQRRGDDS